MSSQFSLSEDFPHHENRDEFNREGGNAYDLSMCPPPGHDEARDRDERAPWRWTILSPRIAKTVTLTAKKAMNDPPNEELEASVDVLLEVVDAELRVADAELEVVELLVAGAVVEAVVVTDDVDDLVDVDEIDD